MEVEKEVSERRRIRFARKVIPKKIRSFFAEEKRHRETYFILGLLLSSITTGYVLSILITLLTDPAYWGQNLLISILITNIQEGSSGILEIFLVYLADSCFGFFWLLFFGTIAYCTGLFILSFCYYNLNVGFYLALVLITIGQSSTDLSLDEFWPNRRSKDEGQGTHRKERKFIWFLWYILLVAGSLIGSFALPYLPLRWRNELQVCASLMAASFFLYWLGTLFYAPVRAKGSPLTSVFIVVFSAIRNWRRSYGATENGGAIHEQNHEPDAGSVADTNPTSQSVEIINMSNDRHSPSPVLSNGMLRCLNKAAPSCDPRDIEDTKQFIKLFPMTLTFLMYGIVKSIGITFFYEQGNNMETSIGSLNEFPLAGLALISRVVAKATSKIYDLIMKTQTRSIQKASDGVKIALGLMLSVICCAVAQVIEVKRLRVIRDSNILDSEGNYILDKDGNYRTIPMSVFWLTPQFVLLGAMNGLAEDGVEGFFKQCAPKSMKKYANALAEGVSGSGTILSLALIFTLQKLTEKDGRRGWFANNADASRLDNVYKVLAIVSSINVVFFFVVGYFYYLKHPTDDDDPTKEEQQQPEHRRHIKKRKATLNDITDFFDSMLCNN